MMKKEIFINQSILRRGFFHFLPRDSIQTVQRVSSEAQNKTFKSRESIPVLPDLFHAPSSERDKFQMSCFLHKIPSLLRIFSLFPCPVSTAINRQNGSGALSEYAFCLQLKQSMGQLNGHPFYIHFHEYNRVPDIKILYPFPTFYRSSLPEFEQFDQLLINGLTDFGAVRLSFQEWRSLLS